MTEPPPFVFAFRRDPGGAVHCWLACPKCGRWAEIDGDQIRGRVSAECPHGCGYHETVDFLSHMDKDQRPQAEAIA